MNQLIVSDRFLFQQLDLTACNLTAQAPSGSAGSMRAAVMCAKCVRLWSWARLAREAAGQLLSHV